MNIFITVGTTKWNDLIKQADKIAKECKHKITCQIGNGSYQPSYCDWFKFKKDIMQDMKKADLVISHEGAGTIFEIITNGIKAIIMTNPETDDNCELMEKFYDAGHLMICKNYEDLKEAIGYSFEFNPKTYVKPKCFIHKEIKSYLNENTSRK